MAFTAPIRRLAILPYLPSLLTFYGDLTKLLAVATRNYPQFPANPAMPGFALAQKEQTVNLEPIWLQPPILRSFPPLAQSLLTLLHCTTFSSEPNLSSFVRVRSRVACVRVACVACAPPGTGSPHQKWLKTAKNSTHRKKYTVRLTYGTYPLGARSVSCSLVQPCRCGAGRPGTYI
jgi:hypothetical protein